MEHACLVSISCYHIPHESFAVNSCLLIACVDILLGFWYFHRIMKWPGLEGTFSSNSPVIGRDAFH